MIVASSAAVTVLIEDSHCLNEEAIEPAKDEDDEATESASGVEDPSDEEIESANDDEAEAEFTSMG